MKKRQTKNTKVDVRVDPDMLGKIDALKKRLKVTSRAEVLRRGLPYLVAHLEALAANDPAAFEKAMLGDEITLEWKREILEAVGEGKSLAKAARAEKRRSPLLLSGPESCETASSLSAWLSPSGSGKAGSDGDGLAKLQPWVLCWRHLHCSLAGLALAKRQGLQSLSGRDQLEEYTKV